MAATASRNLEIPGTDHFSSARRVAIGNRAGRRNPAMAMVRSCAACAPGGKVNRHGLQDWLESIRKTQRPAPELLRQKTVQQQQRTVFSSSKSNPEFPCGPEKRMTYIHTTIPVSVVATFIIIQECWRDGWRGRLLLLSQGTAFGTH